MSDQWIRAKACSTSACVEVLADDRFVVTVRASAMPDEKIMLTPEEWATFIAGVKAGDFDGTTR